MISIICNPEHLYIASSSLPYSYIYSAVKAVFFDLQSSPVTIAAHNASRVSHTASALFNRLRPWHSQHAPPEPQFRSLRLLVQKPSRYIIPIPCVRHVTTLPYLAEVLDLYCRCGGAILFPQLVPLFLLFERFHSDFQLHVYVNTRLKLPCVITCYLTSYT